MSPNNIFTFSQEVSNLVCEEDSVEQFEIEDEINRRNVYFSSFFFAWDGAAGNGCCLTFGFLGFP